jgi:hypothetical protein
MVVDSMIRGKRAAFVRVGKGIVMDVSADPSRGRSEQGAAPSSKPTLEAAVPVVVAVLDAWREKQADVLATRTAFPFSASLALRDRKRLCEPRQRRIEARNANELGQRTSALFGHPFRREPVLGRALDPRYGAWRSYEPTNAPPGPIAYVQVELFDLPRDVDAFITMEVLPNGTVRRLSFEDFAWATRPNGSATPTEVERSVASPRVSASC